MATETLFNDWIEKEKRVSSAAKRRYPHFDQRININKNISFFKSYFSNAKNVEQHSFYPFIRMKINTPRYKKSEELNEKGKPIRKVVPKERPLAYAAHFDAFIYSYYSTLLTQRYEAKTKKWSIYDCVLAYLEKGESNIEFAHSVFEHIKTKGECVALAFDITSFFDGLDHEHLKKMWGRVINKPKLPEDHFKVFKSITQYTFVDKVDLEKEFPEIVKSREKKTAIHKICEPKEFRERIREKKLIQKNPFTIKLSDSSRLGQMCGIPQGSPISACLSNIYMIEFDIRINKMINNLGGLYRRYCDDIIVVVNKDQGEEARKDILNEIKLYHLDINDSKTEITYFKEDSKGKLRGFDDKDKQRNLQYLGFEFNGQNTYIRSSSMSRYYKRMTGRIRENLKAAYGKNSIGEKVFKKTLFNRYTEKGERNFITYAERAMKHMKSDTIHHQYKNSIKKVKAKYDKKKLKFEENRKPKKLMK